MSPGTILRNIMMALQSRTLISQDVTTRLIHLTDSVPHGILCALQSIPSPPGNLFSSESVRKPLITTSDKCCAYLTSAEGESLPLGFSRQYETFEGREKQDISDIKRLPNDQRATPEEEAFKLTLSHRRRQGNKDEEADL
ncbi:hypothetical protein PROFUN_05932 [Planoprotostelium fungivorum]|uniref:Uncharacterized protein n=1 Tax=Planoprotostelium fungivorum TaxID=1890364 RepID=A0A2P6N7M6_9EUKA|nr:hypothetical protein PROFUN_05932 [Planoprotostelium fungivorum]